MLHMQAFNQFINVKSIMDSYMPLKSFLIIFHGGWVVWYGDWRFTNKRVLAGRMTFVGDKLMVNYELV